MIKRKYRVVFAVFILILFVFPTLPASGHNGSQQNILDRVLINRPPSYSGYYVGNYEVSGWVINECAHTNGKTVKYKFSTSDPYLTNVYKKAVRDGAKKWTDTNAATIIERANAGGVVSTYYDLQSNAFARLRKKGMDSSGHFLSWEMELHRRFGADDVAVAHEFGHVIGLCDLFSNSCRYKLMFGLGRFAGAPSEPTGSDIKGAKVINGTHVSHSWQYIFYDSTPAGNRHVKRCSVCHGVARFGIDYCTYGTDGRCIYCGIPNVSPDACK